MVYKSPVIIGVNGKVDFDVKRTLERYDFELKENISNNGGPLIGKIDPRYIPDLMRETRINSVKLARSPSTYEHTFSTDLGKIKIGTIL